MIEMISFLFAIGVGFGLSCLIFGSMLDKSNNIGDSRGSANDYKAYIHYTARKDCLNKEDKTSFCNRYYERIDDPDLEPRGYERVRRLTEEEVAAFRKAAEEKKAARLALQKEAELARQKGLSGNTEDEFKLWESRQPSNDMTGVFKPLNEN